MLLNIASLNYISLSNALFVGMSMFALKLCSDKNNTSTYFHLIISKSSFIFSPLICAMKFKKKLYNYLIFLSGVYWEKRLLFTKVHYSKVHLCVYPKHLIKLL